MGLDETFGAAREGFHIGWKPLWPLVREQLHQPDSFRDSGQADIALGSDRRRQLGHQADRGSQLFQLEMWP
jgi:hypothetical protein